jgi:hypothetical protein
MKRLVAWLVAAAMILSRPAFIAGLVLVVLLLFGLIPTGWWWAAAGGLLAPPLSILFALAVGLIWDRYDGVTTTPENKNP